MSDPEIEEIRRGLRDGRLTATGAARLLEARAAARREVTAHSHAQALQDAHDALDRGHPANYSSDDFARVFPPSAPLGPDEDDTSMTGPGHFAPPPRRQVSDQQKRASAEPYTDEELFRALYPPGTKFGDD